MSVREDYFAAGRICVSAAVWRNSGRVEWNVLVVKEELALESISEVYYWSG